MAECFLSPELGFHSHTLLPPLVVRDGAVVVVGALRWLLRLCVELLEQVLGLLLRE